MKRKTNLFYSSGQDSNYVTFSNYTEALTGNILSINAKMFPSKFICFNIPKLNTLVSDPEHEGEYLSQENSFLHNKEEFIKNCLVGYYENKLAFIRDYNIENDNLNELNINPLDYLLKAVKEYDSTARITFIGQICEQEYNGTFMDNICIIESSADAKKLSIDLAEITTDDVVPYDGSITYLYGWSTGSGSSEVFNGPDGYSDVSPVFDSGSQYYITNKVFTVDKGVSASIDFNVLVPLSDLYVNKEDRQESLDEAAIDEVSGLVMSSASTNCVFDIPMGMWFSDTLVSLERTEEAAHAYRPSWSLCISSQFKPFPYFYMPNEISESGNLDVFGTFAMIMAKQQYIFDEFTNVTAALASIRERLDSYVLDNQMLLDPLVNKLNDIQRQFDHFVNDYNPEALNEAVARVQELNDVIEQAVSLTERMNEIQDDLNDLEDEISSINEHPFDEYVTVSSLSSQSYVTCSALDSMGLVTQSTLDTLGYVSQDALDATEASIKSYVGNNFYNKTSIATNVITPMRAYWGLFNALTSTLTYTLSGSTHNIAPSNYSFGAYSVKNVSDKAWFAYEPSYVYTLDRLSHIDGLGLVQPEGGGTLTSFNEDVSDAFDLLETRNLAQIKYLLAYLVNKTGIFGGASHGDLTSDDGEVLDAVNTLATSASFSNWQEIYRAN